ncbi:hypothetical protein [Metabacillus sp. 84]|uniref:hypothetical protein n=1 Tax=unclassified Metabacillus TaxID=2675274 RepID=UPI003CED8202
MTTKIKLSSDELLFCLYSENLFEQGISMKQMYYPNISDEELNLIFQVACRSLLSKDMVEYIENKYILKKEYSGFIQVLSFSSYSIKASRFSDEQDQVSWNGYFNGAECYLHSIMDNQQVHMIEYFKDHDKLVHVLTALMDVKHSSDTAEDLFVCTGELFETLLVGIQEDEQKVNDFINSAEIKNLKVHEFINDLKLRNGKMDSVMSFETNKGEDQALHNLSFIVPGVNHTWFITGSARNAFTLNSATPDLFKSIITENRSFQLA